VSLDLQKKIDTSGTRTKHDKDVHVPGPVRCAIVLLALLSFLTLEDSNDLPKKRASSHCVNHTQRKGKMFSRRLAVHDADANGGVTTTFRDQ